jgi:ribonucleoside-diphosphate reductase subunit M2
MYATNDDININGYDMKARPQIEPILSENPQRFVLFPIKFTEIWEMYKKQVASFWTADEIDLFQDIFDWEKLNDNERHFIKYVLAFFAARYN